MTTVITRDGAQYNFAPGFSSVTVAGVDRELASAPSVGLGFRMVLTYSDGGHDVTAHVSEILPGEAPADAASSLDGFRLIARAAL